MERKRMVAKRYDIAKRSRRNRAVSRWIVIRFYSGDWRARKIASIIADLASGFPRNLPESDQTKRLSRSDAAGRETGLGNAISVADRETLCLYRPDLFS